MLTIEKLKQFGANADEGLQRCLNNEAFYFKMISRFLGDKTFDKLKANIEEGNLEEAFKAAHALKGVLGNLSLTPLYDVIFEMTELLRNQTDCDYGEYIKKYEVLYQDLASL